MGGETRRAKSLRIGVHIANAVVWEPVYRTHLILFVAPGSEGAGIAILAAPRGRPRPRLRVVLALELLVVDHRHGFRVEVELDVPATTGRDDGWARGGARGRRTIYVRLARDLVESPRRVEGPREASDRSRRGVRARRRGAGGEARTFDGEPPGRGSWSPLLPRGGRSRRTKCRGGPPRFENVKKPGRGEAPATGLTGRRLDRSARISPRDASEEGNHGIHCG